ncbi:MAG: membrane protein insertase YidC, partial [Alphaproteobacteria bacterium]
MNDQRNLIIAIVFSVTILLGFQFLYEKPKQEREQARQAEIAAQTTPTTTPPATAAPPAAPAREPRPGDASVQAPAPLPSSAPRPELPQTAPQPATPPSAVIVKTGPRLEIRGTRLAGSIALKGGRLDDLTLIDYFETIDPGSAPITLFAPVGSKAPYFAEFGWVADNRAVKLPDATTLWRADRSVLASEKPVTLTWDNGQGLSFFRTYSLDNNYMFSITQRVQNRGNTAVTLFPYGLVSRTGTPKTLGFYILHEGPIGVLQGTLEEVDYDDLQEAKTIKNTTTGGWIGITDKYWLAALAPDQKEKVTTRFVHSLQGKSDRYQADTLGQGQILAPGGNITVASHLFTGAKEVKLLDSYAKTLDIQRFDLAIDFGWFYFLTKPFFYALDFFNTHLGNFGLSILLLTVIIKILFFPLANKSYRSMSAMKKLQPK